MTTGAKQRDIADLAKALQAAGASHAEASRMASEYRRRETEALNTLNQCQKDFEAAVAALRSDAPSQSDLGASRRQVGIAK